MPVYTVTFALALLVISGCGDIASLSSNEGTDVSTQLESDVTNSSKTAGASSETLVKELIRAEIESDYDRTFQLIDTLAERGEAALPAINKAILWLEQEYDIEDPKFKWDGETPVQEYQESLMNVSLQKMRIESSLKGARGRITGVSPDNPEEPDTAKPHKSESELRQAIMGTTWKCSEPNVEYSLVFLSQNEYSKHVLGDFGLNYEIIGVWHIENGSIRCSADDEGLIPGEHCRYEYNDGALKLIERNGGNEDSTFTRNSR